MDPRLWHVSSAADPLIAHRVHRVVMDERSACQRITILELEGVGKTLLLNDQLQLAAADEFIYHEALVHPAMVLHGAPRRVLVLGGGDGGAVREVLRWQTVERVVMVEIDAAVVAACREHLPEVHQGAFDDARAEIVCADAADFVASDETRWDVIIVDVSDPIPPGPATRVFTGETLAACRRVLSATGFISAQGGPVSPAKVHLHAWLNRLMNRVFRNAISLAAHVPSFIQPWGFVVAGARKAVRPLADPENVDALLARHTIGGFRFFDGIAGVGLSHTPRYLRDAIAAPPEVPHES
jgi:spermidine synthase